MNLQKQITNITSKGFSCHLVSLTGIGASHFARQLAQSKQHNYIYINSHLITQNIFCLNFKTPTTIILDHFDHLLESKDKNFFNKLRALRDQNKYKLSFILITNKNHSLAPLSPHLDTFYEIATENRLFFPTLNKTQTQDACQYILNKTKSNKKFALDSVYSYSGGIPSLIKTYLLNNNLSRTQGVLAQLWQALGENNQNDLRLQQPNTDLTSWGLTDLKGQILSSSLKQFVLSQPLSNSQIQKDLTKTEFLLFQKLKDNPNQIISRDDLIKAGWPDDEAEGVSDQALDQAMLRLRKKTTPTYIIKTIKSRGFSLTT